MTFYEVLEIDPRASKADIERAFRKLARQVHPDLNAADAGKAEARMKLLNQIRDTLSDPLLRAGYDEGLRLEALQRERQPPPRAAPRPAADEPARAEARPAADPATTGASETEPRRRRAGPILLAFGGAMVAGILYMSFREPRPSPSAPEPAEPTPTNATTPASAAAPPDGRPVLAPLLPTSVGDVPAPRPRPGASPRGVGGARTLNGPRGPFHGRGVVRIGSTMDDVMRILGAPERIEPGRQSGDAVLHYGTLSLQMKNGRVTGGDAAAR